MMKWFQRNCRLVFTLLILLCSSAVAEEHFTSEQLEFFESRIRPVLVESCYECHNSIDLAEGGFVIDHRGGLLKGGDSGSVINLKSPEKSRLLAIVRHDLPDLEMPAGGAKLEERVIADLAQWIELGLPDPRQSPPTEEDLAQETSWEATLIRRKQWWSFQPIATPEIPNLTQTDLADWSDHPIDRFIAKKLLQQGLSPGKPAQPHVLIRRLFLILNGLPPTVEQSQLWTDRISKATGEQRELIISELIDFLLAHPRFGETWARHWMDWIRYAESHGSEGDPRIDNAWMFRDYLIRALNADIPFDQLVREHIAGDLLQHPRLNPELGLNESQIGPAHWRMVFHGFAPTDALDERVRFTDDQINTFSKAFLGITVSCARCHNHKFDPISQADYYALFGILNSTRPARAVVNIDVQLPDRQAEMRHIKPLIREQLATIWLKSAKNWPSQFEDSLARNVDAENPAPIFHLWKDFQERNDAQADPAHIWQQIIQPKLTAYQQLESLCDDPRIRAFWNLSEPEDYQAWFPTGNGLPERPSQAGAFTIHHQGDHIIQQVLPGGVYSHELSAKLAARLTSPDVTLQDDEQVLLRVIGGNQATVRYVVQNYPRNGTVYPVRELNPQWQWQKFDLTYWSGDRIHLELTHAMDAPLLNKNQERSWFGLREVFITQKDVPQPQLADSSLIPLYKAIQQRPPENLQELSHLYAQRLQESVAAWKLNLLNDEQAEFLNQSLQAGILPNQLSLLRDLHPLIDQYRQLEAKIDVPQRVPGLDETHGQDHPLFVRGNHKQPAEIIPRRFLEAIDQTPYKTQFSGRLQLAEDLLSEENPLTRRVIVNRLWHHLFGAGIVRTPDNFGKLGQTPTHPALLDWLAAELPQRDWSLKEMIRLMVTSQIWQQSSTPSEQALRLDPENHFWSHSLVRRLSAEAIRDSMLMVSGRLEDTMSGPSVAGSSPRRSVYVQVLRNRLDPFLRVFDFPEPFSAIGRRNNTNVPAQSLTLMNDPFIRSLAQNWAQHILRQPHLRTDSERIEAMFYQAFSRAPLEHELEQVHLYFNELQAHDQQLTLKRVQLQQELAHFQQSQDSLLQPIREMLQERQSSNPATSGPGPQPLYAWDFRRGLTDSINQLELTLHNGARLDRGSLVVDGRGYATTPVLQRSFQAKTLEAWVQLDHLSQRGGGVLSIQDPQGIVFDAIVFGEKDPQQWLAGSDHFHRTESLRGPPEQQGHQQPVQISLVYHSDGRITAYRNGQPYGQSYQSTGPVKFTVGQTLLSLGVRHLPAGGNRLLTGRIYHARLYDRALNKAEVLSSYHSVDHILTEQELLAELSKPQQQQLEKLKEQIQQRKRQLEVISSQSDLNNPAAIWTELARAMFTLKELIYVL